MLLFFDTTDSQLDVREFTRQIVGLTALDAHTYAPPRLLFFWDSLVFPCVLESVNQQFDYFHPTGRPLRARLTVTFKEHDLLEDLLASPPLESADRTKHREVKEGETLQSIAAQEYNDPRQWRPIAEANDIDNPLTLAVGRGLIIPSL
jgi:hypothetical protein